MADNIQLSTNVGEGAKLATASLSFSGDIAGVQIVGCGIVSGSEGSWTLSQFVGGAGAVAAGVQRVTLASDDPAVVALEKIDDWDESDRAKVNLIAGQAGIAGGAGAVAATVPRVTLASDDPAVAALQLLDNALYVDDADWTNDTSSHLLVGGLYQSSPQSITDGDVGPFQVTSNGYLIVSVNGTATVSGTVTANLSVTDNAVLDAIAASVAGALTVGTHAVTNTVLSVVGGGTEATAQRVTLANDSTGTLTVDTTGTSGLEVVQNTAGDLNMTEASASAIKTAVEKIDDAISGSEMLIAGGATQSADVKVTLDGETVVLGGGSAAFGKLAANSGVDIGDVDVISLPAGNLGQQSMAASLSVVPASNITDATYIGDIKFGEAEPNTAAIKTAVEKIDDTVAVLGTATYSEATTSGNVVGAVRNDDLATLANTDNEIAPLQVNSAGALFTEPAQQVGYLFNGSEKCTIKRATGLAASGTTAMVAAVGGKKIRGLALMLLPTSVTATNVYVANDDNNILGDASNPIRLAVDADGDNIAGVVMPWNQGGWFETDTVNEALNLILSAAQDVIYALTYIEVS